MSKYTTELRYIIENYNDNTTSDNSSADDMIIKALPKLFNFSFPIYDESYRQTLELNIVRHFYTREICCETVGRWKMFLRDRLNIIMPYYNKLYESALLEYNPLYNVDLTTSHTTKNNGSQDTTTSNKYEHTDKENGTDTYNESSNGNTNTTSTENNWNYYNDTPQGGIEGVESLSYLTNATNDKNNGNSTTNANNTVDTSTNKTKTNNRESNSNGTNNKVITNTEEYIEHVTGKTSNSNYPDMIMKYRESLLNIDNMILSELEDLFFLLW